MKPYYSDDAVTIYHGDCRDVLPSLSADVVVTDAPYNAQFDYGDMTDDDRTWDEYAAWLNERVVMMEAAAAGPVFVFVSVKGMLALSKIHDPKWVGAWARPGAGNPAGDNRGLLILPTWEPCMVFGDLTRFKGATPDLWRSHALSERNGHPCPKPLPLMRSMLTKIPGDSVIDPFMGSGTTLRAAKDLGRKATGVEISEAYCEIAAMRMAQEVLDLGGAA